MKTLFLVLVIVVLSASLLFAMIIWRQTISFQEKAAMAKERQEEYIRLLKLEREEKQKQEQEMENQDASETKEI
ncbi:hypothetical protein [Syntrophomonas palmitatica]|uniref:hypothetical protein n=1 Tax=Syntrophomonas palmitatica TaxID=402877 RepID=UPI0006D299BC|nr:hypothetical protein [Syntrophomonas palmitatica]